MGNIDRGSQRTLKVLMAIRDCLEVIEAFAAEGAPPEPSTSKDRALWAAYKIQSFLTALSSLRSLARLLPKNGALGVEIVIVSGHIQEVVDARNLDYIKAWLRERGVSWREMIRPQTSYEGLSWVDLLALSTQVS